MRNAARLGGLAREYGLFLGGRVGDERACGVERRAVVRRVTKFDVRVRRMSIDPKEVKVSEMEVLSLLIDILKVPIVCFSD
jgi:hypothetical protein